MRKTSLRRRKPRKTQSDDTDLTSQQVREVRRRIKCYDDPVRYVVYSDIFSKRRRRLFLDVSNDTYRMGDWTGATLFRRERVARLVAKAYSVGEKYVLRVARVTIKVPEKRGFRNKRELVKDRHQRLKAGFDIDF